MKLISKKKSLTLLVSQLGRAPKQNTRRSISVADLCDSGDEAMSDDTADTLELSETDSPSSSLVALLDAVGKERSKDSESDRGDRGDAESTCSTASTSIEERDAAVSPSCSSNGFSESPSSPLSVTSVCHSSPMFVSSSPRSRGSCLGMQHPSGNDHLLFAHPSAMALQGLLSTARPVKAAEYAAQHRLLESVYQRWALHTH